MYRIKNNVYVDFLTLAGETIDLLSGKNVSGFGTSCL